MSNKVVHSTERNTILSVIKYCDQEKANGQLHVPIDQATKRAAEITGNIFHFIIIVI